MHFLGSLVCVLEKLTQILYLPEMNGINLNEFMPSRMS